MTSSAYRAVPAAALLNAEEERLLAGRIEAGVLAAELLAGIADGAATGQPGHASLSAGFRAPGHPSVEELSVLVAEGEQAQRRFVSANIRLVSMVAGQFAARDGSGRAELFQEGCVGLLTAVQRWDHRRGCRFATYALFWIRATIGAASARSRGAADLPASRAEQLRALRGLEAELAQRLGRAATVAELAVAVGRTESWVAQMVGYEAPRSLDELGAVELVDTAGQDPGETVGGTAPPGRELLWHLGPLERGVLERRMGFADGRAQSYAEVARGLAVTVARVRRVEQRALERLRAVCPHEAAVHL